MPKLRAFAGNSRKRVTLCAMLCTTVIICSSLVSPSLSSPSAQRQQDFGLPALHKINSAKLEPSYSCRPQEDFQHGYENTGLFLSKYSRDMHSPELLFDGACGGEDFFHSALSGDSMSLIEDMGKISLEDVTAQSVFQTRGAHFESYAKVQINHTYAVLVNEFVVRGLFVFTVVDHIPNQRVDLRYAVKEYQVVNGLIESSPGFDWGKGNL